MGLNNTPMSERVHIGFFGRRNAGKSSVMNAVTGQDLAVVSDVKGTTTDPVYKSMELLPIGPVVMIDTPGIDDEGELGKLRVKKSYQTLNKTDAAVLVIDAAAGVSGEDKKLLEKIKAKKIPYVVALNKKELAEEEDMERIKKELDSDGGWIIEVSAAAGDGICELKEKIAAAVHQEETENVLVRDLLHPSDIVVLVVPVDSAAPKGRLILPQQQVIRDILEAEAVSVVVKENGLKNILDQLKENPRMVITDSQVFKKVSKDTPADVPLTSFSILMARYKGNLEQAVRGVTELERLKEGDVVLISEGCTHHRQCEDIGTVKLPRWISQYTGKELRFSYSSGNTFPDDLRPYRLVVHCGACMLPPRALQSRLRQAMQQGVPMTNFGILIAQMKGILQRSLAVFPAL